MLPSNAWSGDFGTTASRLLAANFRRSCTPPPRAFPESPCLMADLSLFESGGAFVPAERSAPSPTEPLQDTDQCLFTVASLFPPSLQPHSLLRPRSPTFPRMHPESLQYRRACNFFEPLQHS